ncbi:LURP-one-related/scramblase family protein [Lapidilactobacillus gannanensis]|uniref:Uncharacterized protein n=1 Tax=Lapidilactobacillus gannanensis TaxID=2486002 RepID=A0ABW4BMB5_9LACO|nr:hypothetical protein [Lapidilactobacillus gannanensis]
MTIYYLLNQTIGGSDSQFIFDHNMQPLMILTGRFGLNQNGIRLLTIDGQYRGRVIHRTSNFATEYELQTERQTLGQMTKMTGLWHQFAYVSNLKWTVLGSVTTNTYQVTHGIHAVFDAHSIVTSKKLDGLQLTLANDQDQVPAFLVAATLNQWVLLSQRKSKHLFNSLGDIAIN